MIRIIMTDLSCHLVQSIPKVTGFVGGKNRPTPMSESDAARILSLMESRQETPRPKFNFERGDDVRVIEGPFEGFNGVVDDVNYEKGKLRVSVSIFGRQTPVELDFVQVSKGEHRSSAAGRCSSHKDRTSWPKKKLPKSNCRFRPAPPTPPRRWVPPWVSMA